MTNNSSYGAMDESLLANQTGSGPFLTRRKTAPRLSFYNLSGSRVPLPEEEVEPCPGGSSPSRPGSSPAARAPGKRAFDALSVRVPAGRSDDEPSPSPGKRRSSEGCTGLTPAFAAIATASPRAASRFAREARGSPPSAPDTPEDDGARAAAAAQQPSTGLRMWPNAPAALTASWTEPAHASGQGSSRSSSAASSRGRPVSEPEGARRSARLHAKWKAAAGGAAWSKKVRTSVSREAQLKALPYWRQGDEDMYTPERVQQRCALRHSPLVVSALQEWWRSVPRSGGPKQDLMDKKNYVAMILCISKAVLPTFTHFEAQASAERDWHEDSHARPLMTQEHLHDALFQLADLWCTGTTEAEYAHYLMELLRHVSTEKPDGGRVLLSLQKVRPTHAQGREQEPDSTTQSLWRKAANRAVRKESQRRASEFDRTDFSNLPGGLAWAGKAVAQKRFATRSASVDSPTGVRLPDIFQAQPEANLSETQSEANIGRWASDGRPPRRGGSSPSSSKKNGLRAASTEPAKVWAEEKAAALSIKRPGSLPKLSVLKEEKVKGLLGLSPKSKMGKSPKWGKARSPKTPGKSGLSDKSRGGQGLDDDDSDDSPHLPPDVIRPDKLPSSTGQLMPRRYRTRQNGNAVESIISDPVLGAHLSASLRENRSLTHIAE